MRTILNIKFGKRVLQALAVSFLIYYFIGFIVNGILFNPVKALTVEYLFVFLNLSLIFICTGYVSSFFNKLARRRKNIVLIRVLELISIISITLILNYIVIHIPVHIYYKDFIEEQNFPPERERLVSALHLIIVLVYYYLVEQVKTQKALIRAEIKTERLVKESTEAQLMALKNQINPHFLFNSLNILESLIDLDQKRAKKFLNELSAIYRVFLENIDHSLIPLAKELELMNSYIHLLETRFQNNLVFDVAIEEDKKNYFLPPGVTQILIENAMKHNGYSKNNPLLIQIKTVGDRLIIENSKQSRNEQTASTGVGLRNVKQRYTLQTTRQVKIEESDQIFTVSLPLLKQEEN